MRLLDTLFCRLSSCVLQPRQTSALRILALGLFAVSSSALFAASTTTNLTVASGGAPVTTVQLTTEVTLTAAVTSNGSAVTLGRVVFCDTAVSTLCSDLHKLGTAQLTSAGTATYNFYPGAGTHNYVAQFIGTTSNSASTSSAQTLAVTANNPTQITLAAAQGSTPITATLTAPGGSLSPTGTLSLIDTSNQNTSIASTSLTTGTATLSISNVSSPPTIGQEPTQVITADFNGDGRPDLALPTPGQPGGFNAGYMSILIGNGDGTFSAGPILTTTAYPSVVAAADFNSDGKVDLVMDGGASNSLIVLLGNGDGTFQLQTPVYSNTGIIPVNFSIGDFNGDGKPDLAISSYNSSISSGLNPLTILLGNGDGTFTAAATPPQSATPFYTTVGDFNGDGKADLIVRNSNYPNNETLTILLGVGDGTFTVQPNTLTTNGTNDDLFEQVLVGDFNGDGKADFVLSNVAPDTNSNDDLALTVYFGNGDGTFTLANVLTSADITYSFGITLNDFNSDGKTDIAYVDDAHIGILLSNGDGNFTSSATAAGATTAPDVDTVIAGDFNRDGVPDIAQADSDRNAATIFLTSRTTTFSATYPNLVVPGNGGNHTVEATYSGDTSFTASTSSTLQLASSKIPTTITLTSSASSISSGQQVVLTATLTPYTQDGLTTNNDTITILSGSTPVGTALLSSGVGVVNTTTLPAGNLSLTAVYGGDTNFAASTSTNPVSITVAAAMAPGATLSPTSLTFQTQTVNTTSATQVISLSNPGTAPLSISNIAMTGPFAQTNNCGTSVAPSGTCSISVTFTPTGGGTLSGTVTVTDNAGSGTQIVTLSGSGTGISMTTPSNGLTIAVPGQSAGTTVVISALSNFTGTVTLGCTVAWTGTGANSDLPTCTTNPTQANVSSSAPVNATVTISTTAAAASAAHDLPWKTSGITFAALFCLVLVPRRRYRGAALFCLLTLITIGGTLGCGGGGGGSSSTTNTPKDPGTTVGSYKVTVTASSSGNATASVAIPLTLQ